MRIGFIGAGRIGGTLAQLWAKNGHEVLVSNSRGPETLADLVAEIGGNGQAGTSRQAAEFGELVVVSTPLHALGTFPAEPLAGKPVVDTNNYYPQRDGQIGRLDDDSLSSAELCAEHLPGAHVVKAFNTIFWEHLRDQGRPAGTPGRRALPIAGDDTAAKAVVTGLIDEIGFDVVDAGPLAEGRRFQPGTPPYGAEADVTELRRLLG